MKKIERLKSGMERFLSLLTDTQEWFYRALDRAWYKICYTLLDILEYGPKERLKSYLRGQLEVRDRYYRYYTTATRYDRIAYETERHMEFKRVDPTQEPQ